MFENSIIGIPKTRREVRYGFMTYTTMSPEETQRRYGFAGTISRNHMFGMK